MNDYIINNAHFLKRARNIRNELLNKTDKYILSDYPITLEKQMIIKTYRRSITGKCLNFCLILPNSCLICHLAAISNYRGK
jgi:hypothetical protein